MGSPWGWDHHSSYWEGGGPRQHEDTMRTPVTIRLKATTRGWGPHGTGHLCGSRGILPGHLGSLRHQAHPVGSTDGGAPQCDCPPMPLGDSQAAHRSHVNTHVAKSEGGWKPSNVQKTPTRQMCGSGSVPGVGLTLGPVSPRAPSNPAEPLSPGSPLGPCGCDRERDTIRTRQGWRLGV